MTGALNFRGDVTDGIEYGKLVGPTDQTAEYYTPTSASYDPDADRTRVEYRRVPQKEIVEMIAAAGVEDQQ